MNATSIFNLPAGLLAFLCTVLLLMGVQESKAVTNFFTILKLILVLFMAVGGYILWRGENMIPVIPASGVAGVWRGATSSFFGYLGYDEVCCLASEALNPQKGKIRFGRTLFSCIHQTPLH